MYSTCLFCHAPLGTNDAVEHFPVGRRLAFDGAKGRLWVVCRRCERWNLTPIEERWEAIEECEKLFRATTLRMSTEHIGLARVKEGLELVRIGSPQRPEMAAWRYGDQFGRRRSRYWAYTATGLLAVGALAVGHFEYGLLAGGSMNLVNFANLGRNALWKRRVVAYVPTPGGTVPVLRGHLASVKVVRNEERRHVLEFDRRYFPGETRQRGPFWQVTFAGGRVGTTPGRRVLIPLEESAPALAALLPAINAHGGSRRVVSDAVTLLDARGTQGLLRDAADAKPRAFRLATSTPYPGQVAALPAELRLALEMATHEDQERAALEGELATLEERWREAEEIANIADNLFVSPSVSSSLDELKHEADGDASDGNSAPPQGTNR